MFTVEIVPELARLASYVLVTCELGEDGGLVAGAGCPVSSRESEALTAVRVGPYEVWTGKNESDCVERCAAR
jgi:hypothetical protein